MATILNMNPTKAQPKTLPSPRPREAPKLTFSPLAWLKLQHFCHAGETEIGGFGISHKDDLLYVEDFVTVLQGTTPATVEFSDDAVADFFDRCVDQGLAPGRFARIWCHTHPGASAEPSGTDEKTFSRVFGSCDWSVMFILSRTAKTYARLSFAAGPGGSMLIPVAVDWERWPELTDMQKDMCAWREEFASNVHVLAPTLLSPQLGDWLQDDLGMTAEDLFEAGLFEPGDTFWASEGVGRD
jgi:proteasome lid subunit RPN8/RPN11